MIYKEIFERIDNGSHVITPTNGLAQSLQQAYAAQQIEQNKLAWPTANILSWYAWCHSLWQSLIFDSEQHPVLLSPAQSLELWQETIHASRYAKDLLQIEATAKQVQAAYQLVKNWRIESIPEEYYLNQDAFAFKVWMESYELRLQAKQWIDEANLPGYLTEQSHVMDSLPERYSFYAFDEFTPVQNDLMNAFVGQGLKIEQLAPIEMNQSAGFVALQDEQSEIAALGNWIKQCYREDANTTIGVVVPHLRGKREYLVRELERILAIENYVLNGEIKQLPFTVSMGKPLTDYPMVHLALSLLQLNAYRMEVDNLSTILRSPFISNPIAEAANSYLFDAKIKSVGQPQISFQSLQSIHEQTDETKQVPQFIESLKTFFDLFEHSPEQQSMQQWSKTIFDLLECFGWPGDRSLTSDEYQTLEAWQACLETLASIDTVARPCNFSKAMAKLNSICHENSFQPQTQDSNVHVMSTEGACGMQFDYCWMLGLHDQAWPKQDTVNPFIPISLQRDVGIPSASPAGSLESARQLTESIVRSAKHVILSHPMVDGDSKLRPSPVFKQYPDSDLQIEIEGNYIESVFDQQKLEYLQDDVAPEIAQGVSVSGGAALFKDQAACPFRAFAKHRLAATAIDDTEIGLAAMDRGIILHRALQFFWQSLKHSEQLRRISDSVLQQRITEVVSKALVEHTHASSNRFHQRLYEIEQERLQRLINEWLDVESQRPEFSVDATEKGHHVLFENITVHMRIDRIDKLTDGRLVIIDYKTGVATINGWFGERPDEPQLPLYAITSDGEIAAIAFAKLKTGDVRFVGQSVSDEVLPSIKVLDEAQWNANFSEWREHLTMLAREFRSGVASVDPMPGACRYCDLNILCRIPERIQLIEDEIV